MAKIDLRARLRFSEREADLAGISSAQRPINRHRRIAPQFATDLLRYLRLQANSNLYELDLAQPVANFDKSRLHNLAHANARRKSRLR
ncbi:hypothetical protein PSP6_960026 [Paraburkholderia tropica]|nr:hypothetical protein PSP6_960026 [Paraburkholderia tropica]